ADHHYTSTHNMSPLKRVTCLLLGRSQVIGRRGSDLGRAGCRIGVDAFSILRKSPTSEGLHLRQFSHVLQFRKRESLQLLFCELVPLARNQTLDEIGLAFLEHTRTVLDGLTR